MNAQHDRIDLLLARLRNVQQVAIPVDLFATMQESLRLADRMLANAYDPTAASIAHHAISAARERLDTYCGVRT